MSCCGEAALRQVLDIDPLIVCTGKGLVASLAIGSSSSAFKEILGRVADTGLRQQLINEQDPEMADLPLVLAAERGRRQMFQLLLDSGASVNLTNSSGRTPIECILKSAATLAPENFLYAEKVAFVSALLSSGATVDTGTEGRHEELLRRARQLDLSPVAVDQRATRAHARRG